MLCQIYNSNTYWMYTNNLNITQRRTNLTLSTSIIQKIFGAPKRVKKKLSKLLNLSIDPENEDYAQKRKQKALHEVLQNYEYYFSLTSDCNQMYRVVAINLLKGFINNQDKLNQFRLEFQNKKISPHILKNTPSQFRQFINIDKLMNNLVTLIQCIKKKKSQSFFRGVTQLFNSYPLFDFTMVAILRLYTYFCGYLELKRTEDIDFQDLIIDYSLEATPEIVNMMSECLGMQIQIYSVFPDISVMCYKPNKIKNPERVVIMEISNRCMLLQKFGQYKRNNSQEEVCSDTNQSLLDNNDSRVEVQSPTSSNFKKKQKGASLFTQSKYKFLSSNQQLKRNSSPSFIRENLKLLRVESFILPKENTPSRSQQPEQNKLSNFKMQEITLFPIKPDPPAAPPVSLLERHSSATSLSHKSSAGRIKKQFLSPPASSRSHSFFPDVNICETRLNRATSRTNLESITEEHYGLKFRQDNADRKITIYAKGFSIEVSKK